ncbi:MAG TPA: alpha/beta fold hydrolase [Solirubrobacterales bacterium]|nr:alpha/beta fold hydrolase [Solirubrobacterales bacterium]
MTEAATAAKERRVRVPGAELHVLDAGEGDPVVLVHGWPQHGHMWRHLVPELAATRRVLVPDLRGFGRSEAPPGDYRKHTLAGDLVALLDAEGIERATLIGHDWGGWAAWLVALEHPGRVERLVAIDIPPPWGGGVTVRRLPQQLTIGLYQAIISAPFLGVRSVQSGAMPGGILRGGSAKAMRYSEAELETYLAPLREEPRARASVALYRTFLTREAPAIARGTYTTDDLRVPTLAIYGSESKLVKMTGLPEPGPELRVEVVAGSGHFVPEEKPDEVARLVQGFLAG